MWCIAYLSGRLARSWTSSWSALTRLVACALLKLGLTNLLWRSGAEEDITGSLVFPVLDNDISIYEQVGLSAECGLY